MSVIPIPDSIVKDPRILATIRRPAAEGGGSTDSGHHDPNLNPISALLTPPTTTTTTRSLTRQRVISIPTDDSSDEDRPLPLLSPKPSRAHQRSSSSQPTQVTSRSCLPGLPSLLEPILVFTVTDDSDDSDDSEGREYLQDKRARKAAERAQRKAKREGKKRSTSLPPSSPPASPPPTPPNHEQPWVSDVELNELMATIALDEQDGKLTLRVP